MEARELRIGNLVEYEGQTVIVMATSNHVNKWDLELGYFKDSVGFQRKINQVKPIPLTEEWLFEFGFIDDFSKDFRVRLIGHRLGDFFITEKMKLLTSDINSVKIKYVHQLQNLYFALTGEELTIKK